MEKRLFWLLGSPNKFPLKLSCFFNNAANIGEGQRKKVSPVPLSSFFLIKLSFERERERENHVSGLCREALVHRGCGQGWNVRAFRPTSHSARKSRIFPFSFSEFPLQLSLMRLSLISYCFPF